MNDVKKYFHKYGSLMCTGFSGKSTKIRDALRYFINGGTLLELILT
jgi:hypothetical protein